MLTADQINYLKKIPPDEIVRIQNFDPKIIKLAKDIIEQIKKKFPKLRVIHMGASALEIAGQNDLDIYAFSKPIDFKKYLPGIVNIFGKPLHVHDTFIEWNFIKEGFGIEFYLTDPDSNSMKVQSLVFEKLRDNPKLLDEYELLKLSFDSKSKRDYQKAKYLFYNQILN